MNRPNETMNDPYDHAEAGLLRRRAGPFWTLLKIAAAPVSAYLGGMWCAEYWIVGPVFGIVVVLWVSGSFREACRPRALGFLAASSLIYAFVRWLCDALADVTIPMVGRGSDDDRSFFLAVAAGTILLPLAHKVFFGVSWRRLLIAIPALYALWYFISLWAIRSQMPSGFAMVGAWQFLYLTFLLARRARFSGRC